MKHTFTSVKIATFTLGLIMSISSSAQDIGNLLKGGKDDVQKILGAYISPGLDAMASGLNSGWYNSAKTKKVFRVDIRVGTALIMAPSSEQSFDINKLGLTLLKPSDPTNTIAPTFLGSTNDGPKLNILSPAVGNISSTTIGNTTLPKGFTNGFAFAPQAQINVGTGVWGKNTDISLRFVPQITISNFSMGMWGIGLRHDLYQWIPGLSKVRLFDLALSLGYTRMSFEYKNIGLKPELDHVPADGTARDESKFSNQNLETVLSGFNAEVLISKKLLFFTPYFSLGYGYSSSNLNLKGNYAIPNGPKTNAAGLPINASGNIVTDISQAQQTYSIWNDPFSISSSKNNVYATAGFQLNILLVLRLYGSYTIGSLYNSSNLDIKRSSS